VVGLKSMMRGEFGTELNADCEAGGRISDKWDGGKGRYLLTGAQSRQANHDRSIKDLLEGGRWKRRMGRWWLKKEKIKGEKMRWKLERGRRQPTRRHSAT
jgi:hypothetical protein